MWSVRLNTSFCSAMGGGFLDPSAGEPTSRRRRSGSYRAYERSAKALHGGLRTEAGKDGD